MECKIENAALIEQVIDLALFDHWKQDGSNNVTENIVGIRHVYGWNRQMRETKFNDISRST